MVVVEKAYYYSQWYLKVRTVTQQLNLLTQEYGISFEQYLILEGLDKEGTTPSQLAQLFNTSIVAISRKINGLQQKKLIYKHYGEYHDQRLVKIELAPKGAVVCQQIKDQLSERYDQLDAVYQELISRALLNE